MEFFNREKEKLRLSKAINTLHPNDIYYMAQHRIKTSNTR